MRSVEEAPPRGASPACGRQVGDADLLGRANTSVTSLTCFLFATIYRFVPRFRSNSSGNRLMFAFGTPVVFTFPTGFPIPRN